MTVTKRTCKFSISSFQGDPPNIEHSVLTALGLQASPGWGHRVCFGSPVEGEQSVGRSRAWVGQWVNARFYGPLGTCQHGTDAALDLTLSFEL